MNDSALATAVLAAWPALSAQPKLGAMTATRFADLAPPSERLLFTLQAILACVARDRELASPPGSLGSALHSDGQLPFTNRIGSASASAADQGPLFVSTWPASARSSDMSWSSPRWRRPGGSRSPTTAGAAAVARAAGRRRRDEHAPADARRYREGSSPTTTTTRRSRRRHHRRCVVGRRRGRRRECFRCGADDDYAARGALRRRRPAAVRCCRAGSGCSTCSRPRLRDAALTRTASPAAVRRRDRRRRLRPARRASRTASTTSASTRRSSRRRTRRGERAAYVIEEMYPTRSALVPDDLI